MKNFKSFLNKYNISIKELSCTKEYKTYRKWITGNIMDPKISSLTIFINQFGDRFNYNVRELINCFPIAFAETSYSIINISSPHLPRRNIYTILNLLISHYQDKRVLVINSTAYDDLEKILNVSVNYEFDNKLSGLCLTSIEAISISDYIFPTSYRNIDILRISPCEIGPLLPENEDDIVSEFRKKIINLDVYDYFIINNSTNAPYTSRILGKLSDLVITFSDNLSIVSLEHFCTVNGIIAGHDELAIIPVPPNSYFNLTYTFDCNETEELEVPSSIPVKDGDNINFDNECLSTVSTYLSKLIQERLN